MAGDRLSEDEQQRRRAAIAELMPTTPYLAGLGIRIERYGVVRRGKELIFTEITATDDGGNVVAHGVQTYRIV